MSRSRRLHGLGQDGCYCSPAGWITTAVAGVAAVGLGVLLYQSRQELRREREKAAKKGGSSTAGDFMKTAAKILPFVL